MITKSNKYVKEHGGVEVKRTSAYIYYHLNDGTSAKVRIPKKDRVIK